MLAKCASIANRAVSRGMGASKGVRAMSSVEYWPGIEKIEYAGPDSRDPLAFKWYNPDEVIAGKTMREHLRFAVCYWHTFRGKGLDIFGPGTQKLPWDVDGTDSVEDSYRRADAAFEFFTKLGVDYYTFHDVDAAAGAESLAEFNDNFDKIAEKLKQKQKETGLKLLWGTSNLFSHPRYMNGAGSSPEFNIFARAAAQTKKMMDVSYDLGAENIVCWGGRDGYSTLLNTQFAREHDHLAALFWMMVDYKEELGANFQLLIEPKAREPTMFQYAYCAATTIGFLRKYGLEKHFKTNIEPNHTTLAGMSNPHDVIVSVEEGMLGSIDANTGTHECGWDTDQFMLSVYDTSMIMGAVLDMGGFTTGGLNFDAKRRRESTDLEDLFIGHVASMDAFARGLRVAVKIREEGILPGMTTARYSSWDSGLGARIEAGERLSLKDMEEHALKNDPKEATSGKEELFQSIFYNYI